MDCKLHMLYCSVFSGLAGFDTRLRTLRVLIVQLLLRVVNERSLVNSSWPETDPADGVPGPARRAGAGWGCPWTVYNAWWLPGGGTARGAPAHRFSGFSSKMTENH